MTSKFLVEIRASDRSWFAAHADVEAPMSAEAADRLIVMEGGAVILDGPRGDVMKQLRQVVNERTAAPSKTAAG